MLNKNLIKINLKDKDPYLLNEWQYFLCALFCEKQE